VAELALDQRPRDPLVQQLDSVCMAQLVGRQHRPRVGPSITQNSGPAGSCTRSGSHGSIADHAQLFIPTSRRALDAVSCTTIVPPASLFVSVYVWSVAPEIGEQSFPEASQPSHWCRSWSGCRPTIRVTRTTSALAPPPRRSPGNTSIGGTIAV
jgi:hypothetical protein